MKVKYRSYFNELQNLIKVKVTHQKISEIIGISADALRGRYSSDGYLSDLEQEKINSYFLSSNKDVGISNYITVDYYPDVLASCGNGTFEMSQECIKYDVPATLLPPSQNTQGYFMCHARGNSMYPRIWDGDFVICEHKDNMKIENGEMYIFCFDDQIYLKRLTKNINQIVVESENPDFPTQYIEKEQMNDVHLIGHVICSGRMNGKYMDKRV